MSNQVSYSISIPTTSTSTTPKPYTIYNIALTLPLQTLTIQKRYSSFRELHDRLVSEAGGIIPPAPLPPKTSLSSFLSGNILGIGSGSGTASNPVATETRRAGLENYLRAIATHADSRWRETSAWRAFLNLPSSATSSGAGGGAKAKRGGGYISSTAAAGAFSGTDTASLVADLSSNSTLWLDTHREVKGLLQEARKHISNRANAVNGNTSTAAASNSNGPRTAQHADTVAAKTLLVRSGSLLTALERALKSSGDDWGGRERLGDGELRRRRDLVTQSRKEKDDLENLLSMIGRKRDIEAVVADLTNSNTGAGSTASSLTSTTTTGNGFHKRPSGTGSGTATVSKGRVLGKESSKTRELDNSGVLQLQAQMMSEQDEDITVLTAAVRRQKELALKINEELAVQDDLLRLVDEDVERVAGKIAVAKKRVDGIR